MANQSYAQMIRNDDQMVLYTVTSLNHPLHDTSTVVMMVLAWFILIVSFSICCCAQCFKGSFWSSKWLSCGLDGGVMEHNDDWHDTRNNSMTNVPVNMGDRTNNAENIDICRSYPPNYEAESLPSYTIVSGLPTYDDALEEFRKAGIILSPPMPIIKIFEANEKNKDSIYNVDNNINEPDDISVSSVTTCSCGNVLNNNNGVTQQLPVVPKLLNNTQLIELSPEQLAALSQKRLSLQIAFPPAMRRNSRPRVDMRNNLLRSRAVGNTAGYDTNFPQIHRSSSSFSLANEHYNMQMMQQNLQHRGSLF